MGNEKNIVDEVKDLFDISRQSSSTEEDSDYDEDNIKQQAAIPFKEATADVKNKIKNIVLSSSNDNNKVDSINTTIQQNKGNAMTNPASAKALIDKSLQKEVDIFGEFEVPTDNKEVVENINNVEIPSENVLEEWEQPKEVISSNENTDPGENKNNDIVVENKVNLYEIPAEISVKNTSPLIDTDNSIVDSATFNNPTTQKNGVEILDGKIQWLFENVNPKWNEYYEYKKKCFDILFHKSKQVEYFFHMSELKQASVEIKSVWDAGTVVEQMRLVQQWRNRVKQIQINTSEHLFLTKRLVSLLRGVVDSVQYDKPVSKQEALYYLHLRDFEVYCCWLEALDKCSEISSKTLDGAFDMLSRQVTVMMPQQRDTERSIDKLVQERPKYHNYDTLEVKNSETVTAKDDVVTEWDKI